MKPFTKSELSRMTIMEFEMLLNIRSCMVQGIEPSYEHAMKSMSPNSGDLMINKNMNERGIKQPAAIKYLKSMIETIYDDNKLAKFLASDVAGVR